MGIHIMVPLFDIVMPGVEYEVTIKTHVAGYVEHMKTNGWPSWSEVRNGAGTLARSALGATYCMILYPGGVVNGDQVWAYIARTIFMFDTTAIALNAIIARASLWVKSTGRGDFDPPWEPDICVVSADPASDTEVVAGDYDSLGEAALSNIISWNDWLLEGGFKKWSEFVLTQAGIDAIKKGGITAFGLRNYNYDAADNEPTIGEGSGWGRMTVTDIYDNRPYLVITYTSW